MRMPFQFLIRFILVLSLVTTAVAQENAPVNNQRNAVIVTATATAEHLRLVAPNAVVQFRLEVYDESGRKVFDTEQRGGSVLDWSLQSGDGVRLPDGAYVCVVTVKSLSGRLSQKLGQVTVSAQQASVSPLAAAQLTAPQAQAVGPVEQDASLTVLTATEQQAAVVLVHNGTDGQVARTRGALTFHVGDFFAGTDPRADALNRSGRLRARHKETRGEVGCRGRHPRLRHSPRRQRHRV